VDSGLNSKVPTIFSLSWLGITIVVIEEEKVYQEGKIEMVCPESELGSSRQYAPTEGFVR
jgi:hypothetical protein